MINVVSRACSNVLILGLSVLDHFNMVIIPSHLGHQSVSMALRGKLCWIALAIEHSALELCEMTPLRRLLFSERRHPDLLCGSSAGHWADIGLDTAWSDCTRAMGDRNCHLLVSLLLAEAPFPFVLSWRLPFPLQALKDFSIRTKEGGSPYKKRVSPQ